MTVSQRELAQKLFEGALERMPADRPSYLEDACPSDPQLHDYVLRLVECHEEDPAFLETPVLVHILSRPMLENGDMVRDRYRIVRLLGIGGMGEVYEALDMAHPDHPERLALKTIRRDLASTSEAASRLHREIQLVHKITHPNVCKVHHLDRDSRPDGDLLFLTMDLLEGETLWQRLRRTGPLAIADGSGIARQIAAGLDAAHKERVIHKDLKSSNIMLVPSGDGSTRAVIMDFGIAVNEEEQSGPGAGTDAYMAPERLGDTVMTGRADIYSFGVILYEMVTGQLPFAPGTPLTDRRRLPRPPGAVRGGLPRRWERAILRCLDPIPENRFLRASDAVDALRPARWPVALGACLLVLLLAIPQLKRWAGMLAAKPPQTVAILPFVVAGASGPQAALMDYVAEEIQRNPVIRRRWVVYSPAEARQMNVATGAQAKSIFGASCFITGNITLEGESVTISGRLLRPGDSRPAGTFEKTCSLDNATCMQDGVLRAIGGVLAPDGFGSVRPAAISKDALPYYLQGLYYLRRDSESYDLAASFLKTAIATDPPAAPPRVALADCYVLRYRATNEKAMLAAARKILDEVVAIRPDLPELHASRGNLLRLQGNYEDAARELLLALQADPSNHDFHRRLGILYEASGNDEAAIAEYGKAIGLQPRYWAGYLDFGAFHYNRGRYREAAGLLEQLIGWAPDNAQGLAALGGVYVAMGRNADAERVSRRSCEIRAGRTCYVNLGITLQRRGGSRDAMAAYRRALTYGKPSLILLVNVADLHASLSEGPDAREFFRRAIDNARETLKANVRNGGVRAILAYCKAQLGDTEGTLFELEQAIDTAPGEKDVQKYAVLTYESLGMRDQALEALRRVTPQMLDELESARGTVQLRQDERYPQVAQSVRSTK